MAATEPRAQTASEGHRSLAYRVAQALLALAVLVFLARVAVGLDWHALRSTRLSAAWLMIALSMGWLHRMLVTATWGLLVLAVGGRIPMLSEFNLYGAKSWLSRYLPGKVGMVLGRVQLAPKLGVSSSALGLAALCEAGLHLGLAIAIGLAIAGGRAAELMGFSGGDTLLYGLGALGAVLLGTPLAIRLARRVHQRRTREPTAQLELRVVLSAVLTAGIASLVGGLWCATTYAAVADSFPRASWPLLWGALSLASAAGVLSLVAPGGIGVREAALVPLLSQVGSTETALVVAVGLRASEVIIDASYLGLSQLAFTASRMREKLR